MLSPDQLQDAGDAVAAIYSDMEARMLDHLVGAMLDGSPLTQRTATELNLLTQSQTAALRKIVEDNRAALDEAMFETAERLLRASDEDDIERAGGEAKYPQQIEATVFGMATVLARDNLDMVEGAKRAFLSCSLEAVTKTNSGLFTADQALRSAVRKLERDGISVISYRNAETGVQTVQNKVDVAVRRHVRTQMSQDALRMTQQRMDELGISLVEVSSHPDARPSHAEWQGQCYSLKGEVVIEGTRYKDFYASCMLGELGDILGGVNCRHSYGPYRHGAPRAYQPDPEHPSGLPNDEIYGLTQKQRYLECQIRAAKRELRGAQQLYERDQGLPSKTALLKAQERLRSRQEGLRDLIREANAKCKPGTTVLHRNRSREWAGDMPASAKVSASHRKLDAFLDSKAKQLKAAGVSKARMRAAISGEMAKRGGTAKDFASLAASEQQGIFSRLRDSLDAKLPSTKKANAGKHSKETLAKRYEEGLGGKGLGEVHEKAIAKLMAETAHPKAAALMERHLPSLAFETISSFAGNYYSQTSKAIALHLEDAAAGFAVRSDKAPYQSLFHEAAHLIDDKIGGFKVGKVEYEGRLYGVMDGIARQSGMVEALRKDVSAWAERIRRSGTTNQVAIWEAMSREAHQLPRSVRGGVEDILDGATKGMAGRGHGEIYWEKRGDYGIATEAFAHFFESAMADPDELEVLQRFFPSAYGVFSAIIEKG